MNDVLRQIPWRSHWPGLTVFALALLAFGVACLYLMDRQATLTQSEARYRAQQSTLRNADDAQQQLDTYLSGYRAWQQQGAIGEPQRLQWIEALKQLGQALYLPQLQYTLESSETAEYGSTAYWHDELALQITPMRLDMRLGHEADFSRLLQGLRNRANGLFSVDFCEIRRELQVTETNALQGYCLLSWYSLTDITAHWHAYAEVTP